ncbi:MAG: DUF5677 domain-containing protein [Eubacteriales bacterium]|nr:DUF5677 domain-containing protein [Eubacteriales bacterium]
MFLPEYKAYYEKLILQSDKFIQTHCMAKGSVEKVLSGKKDVNFLNDYRYYAFTKCTKSLMGIVKLLEMGNYEDALILCRTMMECYLSQRYFDDKFDDSTLYDMVVIPMGLNSGVFVLKDGVLRKRDGEQLTYNMRSPDDLSLGKDKNYFVDMYRFLCEIAHCNFSQASAFLDDGNRFVLYTEVNRESANLFPLFVFSKIFENVVLLEYVQFDDPEEEAEDVELLKDLTVFLYDRLHAMCDSLEKEKISVNHSLRETARNAMNSLKEQLGRVDKAFVSALAKQYEKTPLEKTMIPALLTSDKPSEFFEELRQNRKFSARFPELAALIGVEQNPAYHSEGDVWTHTMQALDRAAKFRDRVSDPYAFMLLVLTHDFGKSLCTKADENGVIRSVGHETAGVQPAAKFLKRVTNNDRIKEYVLEMLPLHMKPILYAADRSRQSATDGLFASVKHPADLIYMAKADKELSEEDEAFLWDRYGLYMKTVR